MSKQVQSIVEKLRKNEEKFVIFMHDLSHALTADELELMLSHVREKEDAEKKPTRKKKTEEVVHSNAESLEDKLKEAAQSLRDVAGQVEANKLDIPADVSEIQIEVRISGK